MFRNILVFLTMISIASSSANASCISGLCNNEYIERIIINANGTVLIKLSGDVSNLNCTLRDGEYLTITKNMDNFQEIFASILTLQSQNKPIARVRIEELSNGCYVSYIWKT